MPLARLKDVACFINGKAFQPTDWSEEGIPIIRIQNLNGADKPFNYWAGPLEKQVRVKPNDLLLAWSGTPGTSFGAHIWGGEEAVLNQHIFRVDINATLVTKEWAKFVINAQLNTLIGLAHGGVGLKHVTRGMVEELEIPVPPIPEQIRIAAILDQADALRTKRREALAQLDNLTQSIFIEMFGDPVTNPMGWHSTALETIATKITDGEHQTPKRTESGIKLLSARNVRDGYLDFGDVDFIDIEEHQKISKRCNPEFGDILISCSGSIGRVAIVETKEPLGLVRSAALVKPNHQMVSSKYLETYLRTPYMNQMMIKRAHSSSQANLFQGPIRTLPVMLPPFSLQQEFLSKAASVQWLKAAQHSSSAGLDALFESLQHRAFRGEL